ncbi:hypothetical protein [Rudaeicoccus suwonensis]|uniref:Uncharacterized protein n=1 Tax=Rudaeicoccus suwonensis TaxID=657409 RepID=A0A561ECH7_9MICO|nr:hypothetical protein [Rudaeicoccus suwonensis]TWE13312.1 hypothetical protein BKA23_2141 [Rudaeicoccus suwonensis]
MSVLVHLCRGCGHHGDWHLPRNAGYTGCQCCRAGAVELDPMPVLQETFAMPGWSPEPLWAPGTARNPGTMHASTTCSCDACTAAFEALTGRAEAG